MSIANFVQVITACEQASGPGMKDIIKAQLKTADTFCRFLVQQALDPFVVFGVKKYDAPTAYAAVDPSDAENSIKAVLSNLENRVITGNAAREAVTELLSMFSENTAKYLARVIDKDLQAGFSAETFNKIWPNDPVRVFDVMLADKCAKDEDFANLTFPCIADIKYDGERNVCFQLATGTNFAPAGSSYRSRSGKLAEHMAGLFDEELARIREYLGYDFVLDGERMARDYIETINAKKEGAEGEEGKKNMRFRAFFLMPLEDWLNQSTTITMAENRARLEEVLKACNCEKITLSSAIVVNSIDEMMSHLDVVTAPGFDGMPKGQEGLILKRLDAVYRWDRSLDWCKVKKFFDFEGVIENWEFGRKRNSKRMGRVNVYGYLEDGTYFEVGVGSGWSDADRDDCAANFETKWKGRIMQGKYQEVSLAKNATVHSLRFPTALSARGFRDDKVIEKP